MVRTQKVGSAGNSLCVRIARPMAERVGLARGSLVIVEAAEGVITVRPTTEAALLGAAVSMTVPAQDAAAGERLERVERAGRKLRRSSAALARAARRARPRRGAARRRGK